jgi:hypothetical protein
LLSGVLSCWVACGLGSPVFITEDRKHVPSAQPTTVAAKFASDHPRGVAGREAHRAAIATRIDDLVEARVIERPPATGAVRLAELRAVMPLSADLGLGQPDGTRRTADGHRSAVCQGWWGRARMRRLCTLLLFVAVALVASCASSKSGDGTGAPAISDPHPYPGSIDRHGKIYVATPAALNAVMIDKRDPRTLHAFIDVRAALSKTSGCFAEYWAGGVRRANSSTVVVATALYVRQPVAAEQVQCNFHVLGLPDVKVHLDDPLGSRKVVDAATGDPVPVVDAPPH